MELLLIGMIMFMIFIVMVRLMIKRLGYFLEKGAGRARDERDRKEAKRNARVKHTKTERESGIKEVRK